MPKFIQNAPCPDLLHESIRKLVPLGGRVLDVGSGLAAYHPVVLDRCRELTLVDAFEFYLKTAVEKYPDAKIKTHLGRAQDVLPKLEPAFDLALCIDFVEHLDRLESLQVIAELKRLAPVVIVFTCRGNHPQDHDYLNNGADFWQTHRSRWEAGDLEKLGFVEEVWEHFHDWALQRYKDVPDFVPDALWGVWYSWLAE